MNGFWKSVLLVTAFVTALTNASARPGSQPLSFTEEEYGVESPAFEADDPQSRVRLRAARRVSRLLDYNYQTRKAIREAARLAAPKRFRRAAFLEGAEEDLAPVESAFQPSFEGDDAIDIPGFEADDPQSRVRLRAARRVSRLLDYDYQTRKAIREAARLAAPRRFRRAAFLEGDEDDMEDLNL